MISDRRCVGWLEGIIDGEGCLMLNRIKTPRCNDFNYRPVLTIGSCDKCIVDRVLEIVGEGSIRKSSHLTSRQRIVFVYTLNANGLRRLLPRLQLTLKDSQRCLLIEALPLVSRGHNQFSKRSRFIRLRQIYEKMRILNANKGGGK